MPPSESQSTTQQPRPRFTFSLRTLLLLMVVASLLLAFVAYPLYQWQRQESLIREIRTRSPNLWIRYPDGSPWLTDITIQHTQDEWLLREDKLPKLARLESISISGSTIQSRDLAHLRGCNHLKQIRLPGKSHDDAAIMHLVQLPALTSVDFINTSITDRGARELAKLKQLTSVGLAASEITDNCVSDLLTMPNLEHVNLSRTKITNDAVQRLVQFSKLKSFNVSDTQVGDEGMSALIELKNLRHLNLYETQVTGNFGLQPGMWPELRFFHASHTEFDDRGVEQLAHCVKLRTVNLTKTKVTPASIPFLNQLPELDELSISGEGITLQSLKQFSGHPKLRNLYVLGKFSDAELHAFAKSMKEPFSEIICGTRRISR